MIVLIFLKALRVNVATLAKFSMGEIANFMSTDADRIRNFCNSFHECWSIPLQILTALILLYLQVQKTLVVTLSPYKEDIRILHIVVMLVSEEFRARNVIRLDNIKWLWFSYLGYSTDICPFSTLP